jgi:hypothetical protein
MRLAETARGADALSGAARVLRSFLPGEGEEVAAPTPWSSMFEALEVELNAR